MDVAFGKKRKEKMEVKFCSGVDNPGVVDCVEISSDEDDNNERDTCQVFPSRNDDDDNSRNQECKNATSSHPSIKKTRPVININSDKKLFSTQIEDNSLEEKKRISLRELFTLGGDRRDNVGKFNDENDGEKLVKSQELLNYCNDIISLQTSEKNLEEEEANGTSNSNKEEKPININDDLLKKEANKEGPGSDNEVGGSGVRILTKKKKRKLRRLSSQSSPESQTKQKSNHQERTEDVENISSDEEFRMLFRDNRPNFHNPLEKQKICIDIDGSDNEKMNILDEELKNKKKSNNHNSSNSVKLTKRRRLILREDEEASETRRKTKWFQQKLELNQNSRIKSEDFIDGHSDQTFDDISSRIVNIGAEKSVKPVLLKQELAKLLRKHQLEGIQFCWSNIVLPDDEKLRGCVIAHSMGLGKTLQMVSFCHTLLSEKIGQKILVICPKSVTSNWKNEFRKWYKKASLGVIHIHVIDDSVKKPAERMKMLSEWFNNGDVMIIGFTMFTRLLLISGDSNIQKYLRNPGADLVIVDEGHKIKNDKTKLSQAINSVKTRNRIILTGTPLQNHLMEYYCMINFIRPNYWTKQEFARLFAQPISEGFKKDSSELDVKTMKQQSYILVEEMKHFVHRKDQNILKSELPPKFEFVLNIRISDFQKQLYKSFLKCNEGVPITSNILYFCSILQKVINHPDLIRRFCERQGIDSEKSCIQSSTHQISKSYANVSRSPQSSSSLPSFDSFRDSIEISSEDDDLDITQSHKQNDAHAKDVLQGDQKIAINDFSWARSVFSKDYNSGMVQYSYKMMLLLRIVELCIQMNEKILIFSQFTETLDMIEEIFKKNPIQGPKSRKKLVPSKDYLRLDGNSSNKSRDQMINQFNQKKHGMFSVFLISTKAGSLGINLTSATRVILFDVSWDPSWDMQAIFRTYRYGQMKPVFIYRFVTHSTVEEGIWKRCIAKNWLFKRVVDDKTPIRSLTHKDLYFNETEKPSSKYENSTNLEDTKSGEKSRIHEDQFHRLAEIDDILKDLRSDKNFNSLIHSVVEHESLYIEDVNDKLTAAEKETSKKEYERRRAEAKELSKMKSSSQSDVMVNGTMEVDGAVNRQFFHHALDPRQSQSFNELNYFSGNALSTPSPSSNFRQRTVTTYPPIRPRIININNNVNNNSRNYYNHNTSSFQSLGWGVTMPSVPHHGGVSYLSSFSSTRPSIPSNSNTSTEGMSTSQIGPSFRSN